MIMIFNKLLSISNRYFNVYGRSAAGAAIHFNGTVQYSHPVFHILQSEPLFARFLRIEPATVILDSQPKRLATLATLHNDLASLGVPNGVVEQFLHDPIYTHQNRLWVSRAQLEPMEFHRSCRRIHI